MSKLSVVLRRVATIANKLSDADFSEPELKEYVNLALEQGLANLAENGVTRLRVQIDFVLPAVGGGFTGSMTAWGIPDDFDTPIRLWEQNADGTWVMMQQVRTNLPQNATPQENLRVWGWWQNTLWFIGSDTPKNIRLLYYAKLVSFSMPSDQVDLPGFENVLTFGAAALCAAVVAPEKAQFYEAKAAQALESFINLDVRTRQSRPFRRHRRRCGIPMWR